ncbi:MAG: hypothetical protein AAF490_12600 [Chloroflexota bacterium]
MSRNQGLINWIVILLLLAAFAIITAVWSGLIGNAPVPSFEAPSGDTRALPVEPENIDFEIKPIPITQKFPALGPIQIPTIDVVLLPDGIKIEEINPLIAIGVLFGLVIGGIVVVGGAIATPIMLFSRIVSSVKEDESYQESEAKLVASEKELIKQMNEGRSTRSEDHDRPQWSAISTALIILMFAWFASLVLNGTFFPEGSTFLGGDPERFVRTTPYFVWGTVGATLLALIAWMRPRSFQAASAEKADSTGSAIPWDTIAVLVTGLIIVGLGIGAMAYVVNLG